MELSLGLLGFLIVFPLVVAAVLLVVRQEAPRRVVVIAVLDDNDASFVAAPATLREALQGGALALPRHLQGVLACPFKGRVVVELDVAAVLRLHRGEARLCLHRHRR